MLVRLCKRSGAAALARRRSALVRAALAAPAMVAPLTPLGAMAPGSPAGAQTCAADWLHLNVAGPSPRGYFGLAFDPVRDRTVLFAGIASLVGQFADTWEWDGSAWALRATTPALQRNAHTMVYDSVRQRVVFFAGQNGGTILNDSWEWTGTAWVQLATTNNPPVRFRHAAAYDSARGKHVIFGGQTLSNVQLADTWELDSQTLVWTKVAGAGPAARHRHAMEFDALHAQTLLYGGQSGNVDVEDTWVFDGVAWTQKIVVGPPKRDTTSMTYDTDRNRIVLFGGVKLGTTGNGEFSDTWEWTGSAWLQRAATGPSGRHRQLMAYDRTRRETVMFGGYDFVVNLGDTWVWNGGDAVNIATPPDPETVVYGQSASFHVGASGTGALTYRWQRNGAPIEDGQGPGGEIFFGAHADTLMINGVRAADAGVYRCVIEDSCGATISPGAALTVLCPGDATGDATVDFADLNVVLSNFGVSGPAGSVPGDLDNDGDCDFSDLNIVLSNYGVSC